jgi:thiamine pyrophosphokinase
MSAHITKAILVAGGQIESGTAVDAVLDEARTHQAYIVGVDSGTDAALTLNLSPTLVIGDMDSISPYVLATIEAQHIETVQHPPEKDETDLELALIEVVQRGARWIRILGATGNRLDQTIANIYLLGLPILDDIDVKLVAGEQTTSLIGAGTHPLIGEIGDTISLIPFNADAQGITTEGLKYPLKNETLSLGPARGVSNVIVSPKPSVTLKHGQLLVIHTVGRA